MEAKGFVMAILCGYLVNVTLAAPGDWFWNTPDSRRIANEQYGGSWLERQVATQFGDELPNMRNDLMQRKNNGEGFWGRHWNAWTTRNNWDWQTEPCSHTGSC